MEQVNCLMCGSSDWEPRFHGRDRLHHAPGKFTLVECRSCSFLFLSPRPDPTELPSYYPDDYLSFRPSLREERSRLRRLERLIGLRRRAQAVIRNKSTGHLLDVGCGTGDFLEVMQLYPGWTVQGLEPHAAAAARARKEYGVPVEAVSLDQAAFPDETFDAVTLWDVLEHVPDPRAALRKIYRMLRPDGIVVIGVPDRDSIDAKLFGPTWAGLDFPRHFSVFAAQHLTRCCVDASFDEPTFVNLNGGYQSFILSVRFWLDEDWVPNWLRRVVMTYVTSVPFRLAAMPYFSVVRSMRRGAALVAVARKLA